MRDVGAEGRQIRAHVAHQVAIHREELAVLSQRHLRGGDVVAALRITHEMLGAVGRPFHRFLQLSRGDCQEGVFPVWKQLCAKTAADVGADHPHLVGRDVQHVLAEDVAQAMAALAADRQRQMVALGVVFAHGSACLHEARDHTRIDNRDFGDRMRLGKHCFGRGLVADRDVEQHIAGLVRPDLRRALLDGVDDAGHRRQRAPFDLDRLDRVAGLVDGLSHDEGDGIADMAHLVLGEDRVRRAGEGIGFEIEQAGQIAEILDVIGGQDQRNARKSAGAARIDGVFGMRMRRAQHQAAQRGLRRVIVGVAALAADECIILLAQHALTNAELDGSRHFLFPFSWLFCRHIAVEKVARQMALAGHGLPVRRGWDGKVVARSFPCEDRWSCGRPRHARKTPHRSR
ncbi:hypothetical protein ACVWZZ_000998 [Bradyrhizobium sp. LM6.10]